MATYEPFTTTSSVQISKSSGIDKMSQSQKNMAFIFTCTSKVKYFLRFLMIMTRNGNLIPSVFFGSAGQVINVVLVKQIFTNTVHRKQINILAYTEADLTKNVFLKTRLRPFTLFTN